MLVKLKQTLLSPNVRCQGGNDSGQGNKNTIHAVNVIIRLDDYNYRQKGHKHNVSVKADKIEEKHTQSRVSDKTQTDMRRFYTKTRELLLILTLF